MALTWIAKKIRAYGTLVMFRHTIFSLSFGLISLLLATDGRLFFGKFFLILAALLSARTGANSINRVIDAEIDAKNPRTANRQLPTGQMQKKEALAFSVVCFLLMGFFVFFINSLCLFLLPVAVFFLWLYSYTKRFTWTCHFFLGFTCALAPLGAWLAVTGSFGGLLPFLEKLWDGWLLAWQGYPVLGLRLAGSSVFIVQGIFLSKDPIFIPLFLGLANGCWVAGFDIIYGAQDVAFDRANGIHSLPARFGIKQALRISTGLHIFAVGCLLMVGLFSQRLGFVYFLGIAIVALLLFIEHAIVNPDGLKRAQIAAYSLNEIVGLVFLGFTLVAVYI